MNEASIDRLVASLDVNVLQKGLQDVMDADDTSGSEQPAFSFVSVPRLSYFNYGSLSQRASDNVSLASQSIADEASEERLRKIETQLRGCAAADDVSRLDRIERQLDLITKALAAMTAKMDGAAQSST